MPDEAHPPAQFRRQEFKDRSRDNSLIVHNPEGLRIVRIKLGRLPRGCATIYGQGLDYQVLLEAAVCKKYPKEGVNEFAATTIAAACWHMMIHKLFMKELRQNGGAGRKPKIAQPVDAADYRPCMTFADRASYMEKASKEWTRCCEAVKRLGLNVSEINGNLFDEARLIVARNMSKRGPHNANT